MMMHPTLWNITRSPCAQPQARPTLQISFLIALHRRIIWISYQIHVKRRPYLHSFSVSYRNHTPLSGAFSQVCKLENVSHSCNHQHSLSFREEIFIMPSITCMYFEFYLGCNHQHSLSTREVFFTKLVW
jgi:hypothetical protein